MEGLRWEHTVVHSSGPTRRSVALLMREVEVGWLVGWLGGEVGG